jgi:hypothetical protein
MEVQNNDTAACVLILSEDLDSRPDDILKLVLALF